LAALFDKPRDRFGILQFKAAFIENIAYPGLIQQWLRLFTIADKLVVVKGIADKRQGRRIFKQRVLTAFARQDNDGIKQHRGAAIHLFINGVGLPAAVFELPGMGRYQGVDRSLGLQSFFKLAEQRAVKSFASQYTHLAALEAVRTVFTAA